LRLRERNSVDEAELSFFAALQKLIPRKKPSLPRRLRRICCVDARYTERRAVSVASLFEDGSQLAVSVYRGNFTFPYVSGLMYLHEGPFVVEAVRRLKVSPQLVCFDAHGLAHPRSAGLATICGAVLGIPSVGIAKTLLVGKTVKYKQRYEKVVHDGKVVGLWSLTGKPRCWSPGYSVSLKELESIILRYGQICLKAMDESDRLSRSETLD
jgi:deoxyribonuclease V